MREFNRLSMQLAILLLAVATAAMGQQPPRTLPLPGAGEQTPSGNKSSAGKRLLSYQDQLVITAKDVEGLTERVYRVEMDGSITLPLAGKLKAFGLTIEEFEKELITQLGVFVRSPQVSVRLLTLEAETITVAGTFRNPGVYALPERRSLLEVLSAVGGLQPNAARTIKITRRLDSGRPPLPIGVKDPSGTLSTASVNVSRLMEVPSLQQIRIEANDMLLATPAGMVFLTGEVLKPGPFELVEKDSLDLTELISMGGGFNREAATDKIKILRPILNGSRRAEIAVDVKSILDGRSGDFPIMPNDMVIVPRAGGKSKAFRRAAMVVVPGLATALIYLVARR